MVLRKGILVLCLICFSKITAQEQRNGIPSVLHNPPQVEFSWIHACFGDTTQFINGSIRANTYQWFVFDKLGDTLYKSTNTNISYYFSSKDTFYVELIGDNGHPTSITEMIVIDTATTADFTFMHCANQFQNHSTCATSFFWDFGDGSTSTDSIPIHQYADTGYYQVKFVASNGISSDTANKQIFVDVNHFPTGAFTYYLSHDTLFVHAVDSGAGYFYNWNFGDFTPHVYKRDTFHVYSDTGTFILNFSDWNICSTAYSIDTIKYYINPNEIRSFTYESNSLQLFPNPVSPGEELKIIWKENFPPGNTVSIFNSLGEQLSPEYFHAVYEKSVLRMKVGPVPKGIYRLLIMNGRDRSSSSFIVH